MRSTSLWCAVLTGVLMLVHGGCTSHRPPRQGQEQTPAQRQEALRLATKLEREGMEAQKAGKYAKAIDLYKQSLTYNDQLPGVWNNLGVCLMETEDNFGAVNALNHAADLLKDDPRPYENLGLIYLRLGWSEDALNYYTKSLERDQNWLNSLRGAVAANKSLLRSDRAALERVRRATLLDHDAKWKAIYDVERMRIEQDLAEKEKNEVTGT